MYVVYRGKASLGSLASIHEYSVWAFLYRVWAFLYKVWVVLLQACFSDNIPKAFKQVMPEQGTKSLDASFIDFIYSFADETMKKHTQKNACLTKGCACSQTFPELERGKSSC